MVAAEGGLCYARLTIRIKTGEQDRGFDLCGCDRRGISDPVQAAAGDVKRRAAVFTDAFDFCTHQRKRLHNALHRTLLNGSVPGQRCFKGLTAQNAGNQPGCRAGIACIQHLRGRRQPV